MSRTNSKETGFSIIALDKFILSTRDSGYKGTSSAISELVDNAIQADANEISITVEAGPDGNEGAIEISVLDDGYGMPPLILRRALRFGGSTRFGDRRGLGRFGMGLPNSSLSQAQRVDVYTWQAKDNTQRSRRSGAKRRGKRTAPERVYTSYLDVGEIVSGALQEVPRPRLIKPPSDACRGASGTLVRWTRCDRLDNRRVSTITRKLSAALGRRFRHFLWGGLRITVNGEAIKPIDPLYLNPDSVVTGASPYGDELSYEIYADPDSGSSATGWVRVRFSELPVHEWHGLSNEEKRRKGISKGAGVSIVRARREVDYGWFFMGGKRRENYDDWWRCEISFDPVLDEAFGMTHTKQQIRPKPHLLDELTPDIELQARALNSRARKAHLTAKSTTRFTNAERVASKHEHLLKPLLVKPDKGAQTRVRNLKKQHASLREPDKNDDRRSHYTIVQSSIRDRSFFSYELDDDRLILLLNTEHPFYREIYQSLADSDMQPDQRLREKLELVLLAAARSEAATGTNKTARDTMAKQRQEWSNILAIFLNG